MKRKGCFHLRIASILIILQGILSIVAIRFILGAEEGFAGMNEAALQSVLWGITGLYVIYGLYILAGLIGLALSNKKSAVTVVLGFIMFVAQLVFFFKSGSGFADIIISILLLVIPYYYLHNAVRNYRDKEA